MYTVVVLGTPGLVGDGMGVLTAARGASLVASLSRSAHLRERRQRQQRLAHYHNNDSDPR